MKKFTVTTLYFSDGTCVYSETRKGQSEFMAQRAVMNSGNEDAGWTKKVIIEEEGTSE